MITCFFLIIKPESFDAKAHKSVFPVKKNLYFHNRVKVNTLIQTLWTHPSFVYIHGALKPLFFMKPERLMKVLHLIKS